LPRPGQYTLRPSEVPSHLARVQRLCSQECIMKLPPDTKESNFLRSALEAENSLQPFAGFARWSESCRSPTRVEQIPFAALEKWRFDPRSGELAHESGKFFRVEGLGVEMNFGLISAWEQPIINQPEIGILGIITRR